MLFPRKSNKDLVAKNNDMMASFGSSFENIQAPPSEFDARKNRGKETSKSIGQFDHLFARDENGDLDSSDEYISQQLQCLAQENESDDDVLLEPEPNSKGRTSIFLSDLA